MASLVWNKGERAIIDGFFGGQANYTPSGETAVLVPSAGANWGLGLGTRVGGVGSTKSNVMAQILEIGTATPNGYGRATIVRDQSAGGWPASTKPSTSYQSTTAQKTFSFTGTPSPNGATLWFVAGSTTINDDNCLFGSDTAATRTFGNGDTERVTPTYQQT